MLLISPTANDARFQLRRWSEHFGKGAILGPLVVSGQPAATGRVESSVDESTSGGAGNVIMMRHWVKAVITAARVRVQVQL
jgi:hypothetical protein